MVRYDTSGGFSHTVGINSGLKIMYEYIESHELKLNTKILNKCCESTKYFKIFVVLAELKDNRVHAKKV